MQNLIHADIYGFGAICSIPFLAERMNESKYAVRKAIKSLEKIGFVCKEHYGGMDDDDHPYCYHGWTITKYVTATTDYIEEMNRFKEEMQAQIGSDESMYFVQQEDLF